MYRLKIAWGELSTSIYAIPGYHIVEMSSVFRETVLDSERSFLNEHKHPSKSRCAPSHITSSGYRLHPFQEPARRHGWDGTVPFYMTLSPGLLSTYREGTGGVCLQESGLRTAQGKSVNLERGGYLKFKSNGTSLHSRSRRPHCLVPPLERISFGSGVLFTRLGVHHLSLADCGRRHLQMSTLSWV
ncbi:hypothetical protein BS47DRAFT_1166991 [Hydnum rufescens UP504]|uniref:Uncharacterized protein n=1 Tax=Hydnum rufescens UP504 TaxID=1448309 RepID=A0A9P6AT92_9AGAM|nr:hypothetical protein BS47DRAFT_1166991 [Hydnum rufescens UP504]